MKKKSRTLKLATIDGDLKSMIQNHSKFFDNLVELIPARFYLPVEDNEKPWFQGLSKVAKASAKKESRENLKKARRAKLDPEKPSGTLDLLKKTLVEEEEEEEEEENEDKDEILEFQKERKEKEVTYEEIRQRFHRRLEELRSNRKAGPDEESNRWKKRQINAGKRKRHHDDGGGVMEVKKKKQDDASELKDKIDKDVSKAVDELAFGHVKIGDKDERGGGKKKRKLSKLQALEEARKLEEAKKDPEKGEIVAKKHSWDAATSRAMGVKVHDDPKLINKSIKKEKKKHEKNVGKWKERVDSRDKVRAEKQKTRSDNISGRKQQKKMRKIEKREKKLMRPGFEGRKQGFINES